MTGNDNDKSNVSNVNNVRMMTSTVERTKRGVGWGLLMVAAVVFAAATAHAETDKRELQARESFAAGRYQEALDIFVKLYAEKVHPNYLRNIGRCYQNLGEPDKAISSFREYLRQSKSVRADERQEVEGYINEMEELKRQRVAAAATPPPPSDPPLPLPVAPNPGATTQTQPVTLVDVPAPPEAAGESKPVYTRWWFWTLIGAAVVGGVAVAAATGVFTTTEDAACVGTCK